MDVQHLAHKTGFQKLICNKISKLIAYKIMTQNFWFHPDPKAVRDICDQQKRFIIVLDVLLSTLWVVKNIVFHKEDIEETYLLSSYTKSRAENQVRVRNSNNLLRIRNTSHCTLMGCSLKGVMMRRTPLSVWKGWANSSLVSWAA